MGREPLKKTGPIQRMTSIMKSDPVCCEEGTHFGGANVGTPPHTMQTSIGYVSIYSPMRSKTFGEEIRVGGERGDPGAPGGRLNIPFGDSGACPRSFGFQMLLVLRIRVWFLCVFLGRSPRWVGNHSECFSEILDALGDNADEGEQTTPPAPPHSNTG